LHCHVVLGGRGCAGDVIALEHTVILVASW
jgi:hypothetical protein